MNKKIELLKEEMDKCGIDYYIVSSRDEFQGEYVPEYNNRLKYLTGFTGSNGTAIISKKGKNYFLTDGRYLLQAKQQLEDDFIIEQNQVDRLGFIANLTQQNKKVGLDPKILTIMEYSRMVMVYNAIAENFTFFDKNLVDQIWDNKKTKQESEIFIHNIKYSGKSAKDKISDVVSFLKKEKAGSYINNRSQSYFKNFPLNAHDYYTGSGKAVILTDPHSICWLLNIRGKDLQYTPIVLCYGIIHDDGRVFLFLSDKPDIEIEKYLNENNIEIFDIKNFQSQLQKLLGPVFINHKTSVWVANNIKESLVVEDPCVLPKAIKNDTEIKGAINAHIKDGVALQEFFIWLEKNLEKEKITELSIERKLYEFRKQQKNFFSSSFPAIVGFQSNGAIIHYKATKESNQKIKGRGLLLIDSGGQYFEGTTDVTRTIAIGKPTEEEIHNFTLVLKGHIKVASSVFPEGTTGADLDVFAREDLKKENKDFAHGTGHGVGSFLSVHEGPQSISLLSRTQLLPGMIISIEPGFYKEGEYGIRIENLAYIQNAQKKGYLEFVILTKVPISENLIDFSLLSDREIKWLKEYNKSSIMIS